MCMVFSLKWFLTSQCHIITLVEDEGSALKCLKLYFILYWSSVSNRNSHPCLFKYLDNLNQTNKLNCSKINIKKKTSNNTQSFIIANY